MTKAILRFILDRVEFHDWVFFAGEMGDGFYLQVRFFEADNEVPQGMGRLIAQHGRKWYISPHSTEGEVIQTALSAVFWAMEHEVREQFKVDGKAIFGPHLDINQLLRVADKTVERAPRLPGTQNPEAATLQ